MVRFARSTAGLLLAVAAFSPRAASAQVIFSTFAPPGNGYSNIAQSIYYLSAGNWLASSFVYTGTGATLGSIDFAAVDQYSGLGSPLDVTFRTGTDMNSAIALETWSLPNVGDLTDQIYTVTSNTPVSLVTGNTYWVELSVTGYEWGWNYNSQSPQALGNTSSSDGGLTWNNNDLHLAPAFDVTAATVVPEPATMSLMAMGLVGMSAAARRRRRTR